MLLEDDELAVATAAEDVAAHLKLTLSLFRVMEQLVIAGDGGVFVEGPWCPLPMTMLRRCGDT